jgi:hypothetical protein
MQTDGQSGFNKHSVGLQMHFKSYPVCNSHILILHYSHMDPSRKSLQVQHHVTYQIESESSEMAEFDIYSSSLKQLLTQF